MDFQKATEIAKKWVTSTKTRFELIDIDAEAKRLVFASNTSSNDSFYIMGPNTDNNSISWHAWSDNPDVLARLNDVIDGLQSCKERPLTDILSSINKALASSQGAAAAIDADDEGMDDDEGDDEDDEESDCYDEAYYDEDDMDVLAESSTKPRDDSDADDMYTKQGSPTAVNRLMKDWKSMKGAEKFGIKACPRESNLFVWDVKLTDIPKETILAQDLQEYSKKYKTEPVILMEVIFPQDYPMSPPFVRVVKPRFAFLTGHITIGGSICMELLTRSGWRPTNDIESIMVQIRSEILSDKSVTLDKRNMNTPYDKSEAQTAFKRMVRKYGWDK